MLTFTVRPVIIILIINKYGRGSENILLNAEDREKNNKFYKPLRLKKGMAVNMKKLDFLSAVRSGINNKASEELKKIIVEFARLIEHDNFEEALLTLEKIEPFVVRKMSADLLAEVKQLCESVNNGDYDLTWDYDNGYYHDYYDDEEILADSDGLGQEIQGLLENAMAYVSEKRYSEAFSAFDALFSLTIPLKDYDDLSLSDLFSQDLIDLNEDKVLRHYAYSAVVALSGAERVEKLYEIVLISHYRIKLPEIERTGADGIPLKDEFNKQWIEFLMAQELYHHEHILIDAVLFSGGVQHLNSFTSEHGMKFQSAYTRLTEIYIDGKEYSQAVSVIQDGFSKLNGINAVRVKLADFLLDIGVAENDKSLIEKAVWEGFYSSLDLHHYMNICDYADDKMKDSAIERLEECPGKPDENYIRFLYGDYESVYISCISDKKSLGWSSGDKGGMIPLFVALLSKEKVLSSCVKKLIESVFMHSDLIEKFFGTLGESFKTLSDAEWDKYINWCLNEANDRVEAIVGGQHRGSYYKASALIVSLAEVMRSAGDKAAAEEYITGYKEKYPRHSSFRSCLREDVELAEFRKLF